MHLEKEFSVDVERDQVARILDDDQLYTTLLPRTEITRSDGGVRETLTRVQVAGTETKLRFVFQTGTNGNVRFHKICEGSVWRKLEGEIRLRPVGGGTRVSVSLDGRTRALVPELPLKGGVRSKLEEIASTLQDRIEEA